MGLPHSKKIENEPAVRIGICPFDFSNSFPLGCKKSWGYKSIDGSLVHKGAQATEGIPYGPGDTIGVLVKIAPPKKHMNPD